MASFGDDARITPAPPTCPAPPLVNATLDGGGLRWLYPTQVADVDCAPALLLQTPAGALEAIGL